MRDKLKSKPERLFMDVVTEDMQVAVLAEEDAKKQDDEDCCRDSKRE